MVLNVGVPLVSIILVVIILVIFVVVIIIAVVFVLVILITMVLAFTVVVIIFNIVTLQTRYFKIISLGAQNITTSHLLLFIHSLHSIQFNLLVHMLRRTVRCVIVERPSHRTLGIRHF